MLIVMGFMVAQGLFRVAERFVVIVV